MALPEKKIPKANRDYTPWRTRHFDDKPPLQKWHVDRIIPNYKIKISQSPLKLDMLNAVLCRVLEMHCIIWLGTFFDWKCTRMKNFAFNIWIYPQAYSEYSASVKHMLVV